MDVNEFENKRWQREDQKIEWRHKATLKMIDSGTVLDLGSGDGLLLSLLKKKGIEGKGLDLSEVGVKKANAKGLSTAVHDFNERLPFPNNSFDTVIMLDVLEHLYDPESLLREAQRVSKQYVIVGVPNFSSFPARIQTLLGKVPENNQPKKGHVYWFNLSVLQNLFFRTNLSLIEVQTNTFFGSLPIISLITKILSKMMPSIFGLSFVAKAKK